MVLFVTQIFLTIIWLIFLLLHSKALWYTLLHLKHVIEEISEEGFTNIFFENFYFPKELYPKPASSMVF